MMVDMRERRATLRAIRAVLARDCACTEQDFLTEGVILTPAHALAGRRRFPFPTKALWLYTMGAGVVVSCAPERLAWMQAHIGSLARDAIFSAPAISTLAQYIASDGQDLAGPDLKYVCTRMDLQPVEAPIDVMVTVVEGSDVTTLYQYAGFVEALHYRADHPRPDVAAAVATCGGTIVGIAGAKADSETLWQIGVDVLQEARGRGIGRALVGRVTDVILDRGKVPYYSTAVSNIRSRSVATSLGYWPAWTELYARDRA
jgi:GNAT superfamily N-acetyltransferase